VLAPHAVFRYQSTPALIFLLQKTSGDPATMVAGGHVAPGPAIARTALYRGYAKFAVRWRA